MRKIQFVVANATKGGRACMPSCTDKGKCPSADMVTSLIKSNPELAEELQDQIILCQYLGMYTGFIYAAVYSEVKHWVPSYEGDECDGWRGNGFDAFLMNNEEAVKKIESGKYLVAQFTESTQEIVGAA